MMLRSCYRWLPRILAILFILFISLFALDSFGTADPLWKEIVGFLIHLGPVYALIVALIISWKHTVIGGFTFLLIAGFMTYFFKLYIHPIAFLLIAGTPILVGLLFISHKFIYKKTKFI